MNGRTSVIMGNLLLPEYKDILNREIEDAGEAHCQEVADHDIPACEILDEQHDSEP